MQIVSNQGIKRSDEIVNEILAKHFRGDVL